jgi:TDG/mug DNA glycosylase family protein
MRKTAIRPKEEALSRRRLADHIKPGVRILFIGINPGLRSAATGHHFAGYSNRFWRLLFESELVTEPLTHQDDWRLPDWGLGLTNLIRRPSAGIDVLTPKEYRAGRRRLIATVKHYHPHTVALLGITIYRAVFPEYRTGRISLGLQPNTLMGCPIFVLPNPSGRNAHYSYRTMLKAFRTLRDMTSRPDQAAIKGTVKVERLSQL